MMRIEPLSPWVSKKNPTSFAGWINNLRTAFLKYCHFFKVSKEVFHLIFFAIFSPIAEKSRVLSCYNMYVS